MPKEGFGLLTSDGGIYPLTADLMRKGIFTPFQLQDSYGGVALMALRAFWVTFYAALNLGDFSVFGTMFTIPDVVYHQAHFLFSYQIVPALFVLAAYFFLYSLDGRLLAFIGALIVAIDFKGRLIMCETEFVSFYTIMGFLFLGIRAKLKHSFFELRGFKLGIVAFLSGLAFSNARTSFVYLAACWIPWTLVRSEFKELMSSTFKGKKVIQATVLVLASFWLYLEIYGPSLGLFLGKPLKTHAEPNLHLAVLLTGLAWVLHRGKIAFLEFIKKWGPVFTLVALMFFIGMFEDFIYWTYGLGKFPPFSGGRNYSIPDALKVLGLVPSALFKIFSDSDGVGRNATMLLLIGGVISLYKVQKTKPAFRPVMITGIIAVAAYCRVFIYDIGPARYLFPVFAAGLTGMALLVKESVLTLMIKKKFMYSVLFTLALLVFHFQDQLSARSLWLKSLSFRKASVIETVELFRAYKVDAVAVSDFWFVNQFSVASQGNPWFASEGHHNVVPFLAKEACESANRIGVVLERSVTRLERATFFGTNWKLKYLASTFERDLYLGEK